MSINLDSPSQDRLHKVNSTSKIQVILLDVDNTLLDFHACAEDAIVQLFQEHNLDYQTNMLEVFHKVNNYYWGELEKGHIKKQDIFNNRWKKIFELLEISIDGVEFEQKFIQKIAESSILVPGALTLVQELAKQYYVCIASNSQYEQQQRRLGAAGILPYVQQLFVSDRIGYAKPQQEFFKVCKRNLPMDTIQPQQILMIGDSLEADIIGAKSVGFQTCWYNYHQKPHTVLGAEMADYIVTDLEEIIDLFHKV